MAATNLFEYAHMFLSYAVNGKILLGLDAIQLGNMGIHDEFHRKMILCCVNELIGTSETVSTSFRNELTWCFTCSLFLNLHDIKNSMLVK